MVLQFLHQADLCFLLNGLVCRTVFTYTEGIVCPDELHRQFHKCSHANGRLHVVAEYKECSASGDYTTMQGHTYTAARHGKFGYTSLEEATCVVVFCYGSCSTLQETVCLIGVAQVGRSYNHIRNLFSQEVQAGSGSVTCSIVVLLLNLVPVDSGNLLGKPIVQLGSHVYILLCPVLFLIITLGNNILEFLLTSFVYGLYFGQDYEWVVWISSKVLDGVTESVTAKGCSVGAAVTLVAGTVTL